MSQSLVACKSCKNPISTKASSCPSCGRRRHSEGFNFFAYLFILAVLVFVIWLFWGLVG
jgi:RNA polymerase subunit RPABC4/transcription elongation factor Spt4